MLSPQDIWGNILPVLQSADLRILNLECPLTQSANAIRKTGPNLKAHPDTIRALKHAAIDVVTLANNHIYDYGQDGLKETLDVCSKNGIATVGAGMDADQASSPLFLNVNDRTLAIVNFSENEWCNAKVSSGGANPYDLIDCARQIREARARADLVLVIIHGGHEHFHYPSPRMVKEYRFFAEQGAAAIVCHHTHCISGFEVYNGAPIFYGLGNLFFPSETDFPGWYHGFLLNLGFDDASKPSWEIIPYSQIRPKFGIWRLRGPEEATFNKKIAAINQVIANPELLKSVWQTLAFEKSSEYLSLAAIPWTLASRMLNKLQIFPIVAKTIRLRYLHNLIRCESHRDLLLTILNIPSHAKQNKNRNSSL